MALKLVIGAATDTGQVRETNEDSLCILGPGEVVDDFDALLVVADGMGGQKAGEVASQYATDKMQELFVSTTYRTWVNYSRDRRDYNILVVKEILERLNRETYDLAGRREKHRGMGSTITAALIQGNQLVLGHVGDSRAYLLAGDEFQQLTTDHSWVQEQVDKGLMHPDEAARDTRKNKITRALGMSSVLRIDRRALTIQPGSILLLCTDGLTNMLPDAQIRHVLETNADPQKACDVLVRTANQRGGVDNITAIVVQVLGSSPELKPVSRDAIPSNRPNGRDTPGRVTGTITPAQEAQPMEHATVKLEPSPRRARPPEPEPEPEPEDRLADQPTELVPAPPAPMVDGGPDAELPEATATQVQTEVLPEPEFPEPTPTPVVKPGAPSSGPARARWASLLFKWGLLGAWIVFEAFAVGVVTFLLQDLALPPEWVAIGTAMIAFLLLSFNVILGVFAGPMLKSRS